MTLKDALVEAGFTDEQAERLAGMTLRPRYKEAADDCRGKAGNSGARPASYGSAAEERPPHSCSHMTATYHFNLVCVE